jgi:polyhydroxyalkanoate synthase
MRLRYGFDWSADARGERPVASLTLLTAMLDFSDMGVLDVCIDEAHVESRERGC